MRPPSSSWCSPGSPSGSTPMPALPASPWVLPTCHPATTATTHTHTLTHFFLSFFLSLSLSHTHTHTHTQHTPHPHPNTSLYRSEEHTSALQSHFTLICRHLSAQISTLI